MAEESGVGVSVEEQERLHDGYKRFFDLSVLILGLLFLSPFWLLLWTVIPIIIKLSDGGPVLYRQARVGKNGRVFTLLKFRTMVADAESKGPAWTTSNDPRLTPIGRVLRKTALDELPGLVNIWKGEMILVGPRALDVDEHESLADQVPGFRDRLRVLPGLTGMAQVKDHSDDANEKFRYDLEYMSRMSPWLDAKLIVLSIGNTLTGKWDGRNGKPGFTMTHHAPSKEPIEKLDMSEPE